MAHMYIPVLGSGSSYGVPIWKRYHNNGTCASQGSGGRMGMTTAPPTYGYVNKSVGAHDVWLAMGSPNQWETVLMKNGDCYQYRGTIHGVAWNGSGYAWQNNVDTAALAAQVVGTYPDCEACAAAHTPLYHEWKGCGSNSVVKNLLGTGLGGSGSGGGVVNWAVNNHYFWNAMGQPNVGDIIQLCLMNSCNCYEYMGSNTVSTGVASNALNGGFQLAGTYSGTTACLVCAGGPGSILGCTNPTSSNYDPAATVDDGSCVITPTWDCDEQGVCSDPGTGNGQYASLSSCNASCSAAVTYDCINNACIDPGDGAGQYNSLTACEQVCVNGDGCDFIFSNCSSPNYWYGYLCDTAVCGSCDPGAQDCSSSLDALNALGFQNYGDIVWVDYSNALNNNNIFPNCQGLNDPFHACWQWIDPNDPDFLTWNAGLDPYSNPNLLIPGQGHWIDKVMALPNSGLSLTLTPYNGVSYDSMCSLCGQSGVYGCTDSTAFNYNPLATIDDGSCCYVSGCTDPTANNYNSLACLDDGSCDYTVPTWDCDCGASCYDPGTGLGTYASLSACQASCNSNGNYINYNENASTCDPSLSGFLNSPCSCPSSTATVYCTPGNTCPECHSAVEFHWEYESPINSNNWVILTGSYVTVGVLGVGYDHMVGGGSYVSRWCGGNQFHPGATNYRLVADIKHEISASDYTFIGQPYYFVPPVWAADHCDCMDPNALNYNPNAQCDVGCIYPTFYEWKELDSSCTDLGIVNITELGANPTAVNTATFYVNVNSPNIGEVIETSLGDCYEFLGTNTSISSTVHQVSSSGVITHNDCVSCNAVYGCTDPLAINYNPSATIDDGSCTYISLVCGCTDVTATNYNSSATGDCAGPPCNAIGSVVYNGLGTYGDTSCCTYVSTVYGCTDPIACNYNSTATIDDGSCCYPGCTDPIATNYNSSACCDDGSCITGPGNIYGCTDPLAINYSPLANIDDGTCIYNGDPPEPPVFNDNPCDTIDVTTITPNSCDLMHIAHTWSNRTSTGSGGCVDKLLDDLIMSVALYDMLNEKT